MRRVIVFQGIIAVVIALVFMNMGYQKVESSLFGGVISMINTLLLARSVRMALVLTGFYLGIVTFGLDALQMLVAFAVAQIGYVFNKNKTIY